MPVSAGRPAGLDRRAYLRDYSSRKVSRAQKRTVLLSRSWCCWPPGEAVCGWAGLGVTALGDAALDELKTYSHDGRPSELIYWSLETGIEVDFTGSLRAVIVPTALD